jgi:hypothetical protein
MRSFRFVAMSLLVLSAGAGAFAQRGISVAHAPASGGFHSSASARNFNSTPNANLSTAIGLRAPAASYTGIAPGALRSRGGYERGNRRYPVTGFLTSYYYPFFDYDGGWYGPTTNASVTDSNAQADAAIANALGDQIHRLTDEVEQLRSAQQLGAQPQPAQPDPPQPQVPVTLILKNGQQVQVQNYAVMNGVLWDFSRQPTRKIPIASIDVSASASATEANGGEFPQLSAGS